MARATRRHKWAFVIGTEEIGYTYTRYQKDIPFWPFWIKPQNREFFGVGQIVHIGLA